MVVLQESVWKPYAVLPPFSRCRPWACACGMYILYWMIPGPEDGSEQYCTHGQVSQCITQVSLSSIMSIIISFVCHQPEATEFKSHSRCISVTAFVDSDPMKNCNFFSDKPGVVVTGAWAIIKVKGHQHRWLAGGYDLEIGHLRGV